MSTADQSLWNTAELVVDSPEESALPGNHGVMLTRSRATISRERRDVHEPVTVVMMMMMRMSLTHLMIIRTVRQFSR